MNYVGTTSMVIGVKVQGENPLSGQIYNTTKAYLTFVSLDDYGKPIQVPKLECRTEQEKRRYQNSIKRIQAKKELRSKLEA